MGLPTLTHVFVVLAGRERTVSALLVWLANTNPMLGLLHALIAQQGNIPQRWSLLIVKAAPLARPLPLAASMTLPVSATTMPQRSSWDACATPGTQRQLETHALSAVAAPTQQDWVVLVRSVALIRAHRLGASQTLPVCATSGTRGQMEAIARSVLPTPSKRQGALLLV